MSKGCVIFDFDGVIADTESLHLGAYNEMFAAHAVEIAGPLAIAPSIYYTKYIVYGDREGITNMLRDHERPHAPELVAKLMEAKHHFFSRGLSSFAEPLPGVRELLAFLEERNVPRAICSGARKQEILDLLDTFKLRHHFDIVVAIEDVPVGKPDPHGYKKAFDLLNAEFDAELDKKFSLAIEDSLGGISAAKESGLRVLAVATSLPLATIQRETSFAVENLTKVTPADMKNWLGL